MRPVELRFGIGVEATPPYVGRDADDGDPIVTEEPAVEGLDRSRDPVRGPEPLADRLLSRPVVIAQATVSGPSR